MIRSSAYTCGAQPPMSMKSFWFRCSPSQAPAGTPGPSPTSKVVNPWDRPSASNPVARSMNAAVAKPAPAIASASVVTSSVSASSPLITP